MYQRLKLYLQGFQSFTGNCKKSRIEKAGTIGGLLGVCSIKANRNAQNWILINI